MNGLSCSRHQANFRSGHLFSNNVSTIRPQLSPGKFGLYLQWQTEIGRLFSYTRVEVNVFVEWHSSSDEARFRQSSKAAEIDVSCCHCCILSLWDASENWSVPSTKVFLHHCGNRVFREPEIFCLVMNVLVSPKLQENTNTFKWSAT